MCTEASLEVREPRCSGFRPIVIQLHRPFVSEEPAPSIQTMEAHVRRKVGISQTTRRHIRGNINRNARHTFLSAINFANAS